ncbi:MAG: hypothetical protein AB1505_23630 [Candidatus Latescibacterota bacterium]
MQPQLPARALPRLAEVALQHGVERACVVRVEVAEGADPAVLAETNEVLAEQALALRLRSDGS